MSKPTKSQRAILEYARDGRLRTIYGTRKNYWDPPVHSASILVVEKRKWIAPGELKHRARHYILTPEGEKALQS